MAAVYPTKKPVTQLSEVHLRLYYKRTPEEDGGYEKFKDNTKKLIEIFEEKALPYSQDVAEEQVAYSVL